ncbi:MAG TPA: hypothetical protein GX736_02315 [Mogibacterium sp.]|nr:hypothetical protein [Mogibacterium sp.]
MKKTITFMLVAMLLFISSSSAAFANSSNDNNSIEMFDDGSYFETIITDEPLNPETDTEPTAKGRITVNKSKTTYYKNASGQVMWYVKVTGNFTYGNGSAVCNSATVKAESNSTAWKISNRSSSKYGNKATAKATGKKYVQGVMVHTITKKVTLTCSPTGQFS